MNIDYDFSQSLKNPYFKKLNRQVTLSLEEEFLNIRVEKNKIAIEIDLRKANSRPPQPESEEVENDPPNGLM